MSQMPLGLQAPSLDEDVPDGLDAIDCSDGIWSINGPAKRALDLAIAITALILLSPLMLLTALAIKLDGGNACFVQPRLGRGGRAFDMYKFRSMHADADRMLQELLDRCPASRAEWSMFQKLRRDPRITAVGRFIRATSIDELPQLFNVLKGDMSIVGQRPIMLHQREHYGAHIEGYEAAWPGITGLWQVRGRNQLNFQQRAELGTEYVREWSLGLDVRIIVMTIPALIFSTGAY